MGCTFCSIIDGSTPSWGVYEDDFAVAFLDIGQATPVHTLVVPSKHSADIWSLSEDDAASVMRSVHRVATQLRVTLKPLGMNVTQSNGTAAWQEVFPLPRPPRAPLQRRRSGAPMAADKTVAGRVDRRPTPDPRPVIPIGGRSQQPRLASRSPEPAPPAAPTN